jgi:hypothetical protein
MHDFGDNWEQDIIIEEATVAEPGIRYPLCVAGQGACPPDDAGGPPCCQQPDSPPRHTLSAFPVVKAGLAQLLLRSLFA